MSLWESDSLLTSFFSIQLRLAIQRFKNVPELAQCLGGAEEEKSVFVQSVVEERNEFLLQFPFHIDQQVSTTEQIKF